MITYLTGDLLKSSAVALVNTVNCEGYMGKGIAYQFKLQYPENNIDYVKACKNGTLKIGNLHHYFEKDKIIINFPTKDRWREKSKIDYIYKGLDELLKLIESLAINSIAIPPLGSGNGGLVWNDVKKIIEQKLTILPDYIDIFIYEPSTNYSSQPVVEPKLSTSALVLMETKQRLIKFNKVRLQKTAYFTNLFLEKKYFRFTRNNFGPFDYSIDLISKNIKEFQKFHGNTTTYDARRILYNKLVSETVDNKLSELMPQIEKACDFVNGIRDDYELEGLSTICFLLEESSDLQIEEIVSEFRNWSEDKANRFPEETIVEYINKLYKLGIIDKTLTGYII